MTILTVTKAKEGLLEYVRTARELGEIYEITQRGQKSAFLIPPDVYEGFLETIEIARDKALLQSIKSSLKDAERGNLYFFKEVVGRDQKK